MMITIIIIIIKRGKRKTAATAAVVVQLHAVLLNIVLSQQLSDQSQKRNKMYT